MQYLTLSNPKTAKGEASHGYLTAILHLAPAQSSGHQVCPMASQGCIAACLNKAGRGAFDNIQAARINKTLALFRDRAAFVDVLARDVAALVRKATREGLTPAVRLNGTSDLPWEKFKGSNGLTLMQQFPAVQFYDYTKIAARAGRAATGTRWPHNYAVTFSKSETNRDESRRLARMGVNVAVVFSTPKAGALPAEYDGLPVVDGDAHDLRFLDPRGAYIGLRAKGPARRDVSGFVVHVNG